MKPCLLIPIYDHKDGIGGVVRGLAPSGLHCLIVDDGSHAETRAVLGELEARHPWVEVAHREKNGGRGAALKTGYRLALKSGYSHAIQLDADAPPQGAPEERTLVAVDLSAPGATATDDEIGQDPTLFEEAADGRYRVEPGGVLETGFPGWWTVDPACDLTVIGPFTTTSSCSGSVWKTSTSRRAERGRSSVQP